ncbi:hypothetical protein ACFYT3_31815 [Nocardia amikacinitolerans]|uniref:hypothetical protein n=1 Tax=Nocardia amikacinitolerans TaxID=756689 RepID=UPI0036C84185
MVNLKVDQALNTAAQTVEDAQGNSSILALSSAAVGIGTTSPEERLQVAGNVRLERNGSPTLGLRSRGNGTQHYSLRATNDADAAGGRRFIIRNESEERDDLVLNSFGNFQIQGDVRLERNGSPKLGLRSRGNGTQHYSLRATNDADAAGGERFVIRNENRQRDDLILDNSGDIQIAGDVRLDRKLTIQPRGLGVNNYSLRATDLGDAAGGNRFVIRNESDGRDDLILDGSGNIQIPGEVRLTSNGQNRIRLDTAGANAWLGGNGADGDLVLFAASGDNQSLSQATIHLDGESGDIVLQNADCAEDFQVADPGASEPGTIMVAEDDLQLRVSDTPYDTRVAGVVAGAGDLRPGIVLGRTAATGGVPIALIGRIMCKVDADSGEIRVGDLLTSSAVPGHAMRVADPLRAFGAVIGKALGALASGRGMIPMLVALQ